MSQGARRAAAVVKQPKKKTSPVVYVLIVAMLLAFLGFFYYLAAQYYSNRFPNHTSINNIDVSNMTADNAKAAMNHEIQNYVMSIIERDGESESIAATQIGMSYADTGEVDRLLDQYNPWLWITYYFTKDELTAPQDAAYDTEKAQQVIASLKCFDPAYYTKVQDASLTKTADGFAVQPEVTGNQLNEAKAKETLQKALENGEIEVDLEAEDCYLAPKVLKDDEKLNAELEKINKWLGAEITYDFEDNRIVKVNNSVIKEWITQGKDGTWDIDSEKALEFVKTEMAYKTDTFGLTHVVKTHDGGEVTLKGGDYGWCIARQDTADALVKAVKKGEKTTLEPAYLYKAKNRGKDDIGGTYVEISIDKQTMWCYKDYKCVVETPVVTGNTSRGNGTPRGSVWAMDCHKSPATLGTMDTMGYSSQVTYWMSFTGNVGIHDSSWRSSYGGQIYKTNGSHGCVNTPYEAAKEIFEICSVGTAVVVY